MLASISGGTGLLAGLGELRISPDNASAVDTPRRTWRFVWAEIGVAAAKRAVSADHSDVVLEQADGAWVAALSTGPFRTGERLVERARRGITIGRLADGMPRLCRTPPFYTSGLRRDTSPNPVWQAAAPDADTYSERLLRVESIA